MIYEVAIVLPLCKSSRLDNSFISDYIYLCRFIKSYDLIQTVTVTNCNCHFLLVWMKSDTRKSVGCVIACIEEV